MKRKNNVSAESNRTVLYCRKKTMGKQMIHTCDVKGCGLSIEEGEIWGQTLFKKKGEKGSARRSLDMCNDCMKKVYG